MSVKLNSSLKVLQETVVNMGVGYRPSYLYISVQPNTGPRPVCDQHTQEHVYLVDLQPMVGQLKNNTNYMIKTIRN